LSIESSPARYPGLDLIRLGAALMVASLHLGWWWWRDIPARQTPWLTPFVSWGWVGVPIFFVISGFVIAFSAQGRSVGSFVKSRAARLYPASWICASLIFLVQPTALGDYLRTMVLSPIGPWVSGVYWTLAVEIVFYTLVAVALWRRWSLANLALSLGFYSTAFWILRAINSLAGKPVDFTVIESHEGWLLLAHDGMFFAFGILLQQRRHGFAALIFLAAGFVAVATRSHALMFPGASFMVAPLVWLAATGLIVASVFRNEAVIAATKRWPTRTIGLMTYPLYLTHMEVGRQIMLRIESPVIGFLVAMCGVVLLSVAVLRIEEPLRRAVFYRRMTAARA
jgi:peptidoglycan/LPS O-acetylase OafA/YrhL